MPLQEADLKYIRTYVRERSAIVLDDKEYLIETRLATLAITEGISGLANLMRALREEAEPRPLHRKVVDALTTNETLFFRDVHPFEALKKRVIPELIERQRDRKSLRIWSAACSAGQEPVSIAMLLRQNFAQLENWRIDLLATDLSDEMLAQARSGCYSQIEINRGLPAAFLVNCFEDQGSHWKVRPEIHRMIRYEHFNLVGPWPPRQPFDLILLRNVMIYFDVPVKRGILDRLSRALVPEGYLLMGAAETVAGISDLFEPVMMGRTAFYRRTN
jgi:chemotaxis protein methyltransferase CheR